MKNLQRKSKGNPQGGTQNGKQKFTTAFVMVMATKSSSWEKLRNKQPKS